MTSAIHQIRLLRKQSQFLGANISELLVILIFNSNQFLKTNLPLCHSTKMIREQLTPSSTAHALNAERQSIRVRKSFTGPLRRRRCTTHAGRRISNSSTNPHGTKITTMRSFLGPDTNHHIHNQRGAASEQLHLTTMKTFNRTYLPDSIEYKGKKYNRDLDSTVAYRAGRRFNAQNAIQINVLEKNLRGKTDLHGLPYKAHSYIFTAS